MVSQGNTPTNMMKYGGFAWFNATFILESFGVNWPSKICTWKPWTRTSNHWWWLFFFQSLLLVGGLEHEFYVPCHIWVFILPIDELHHFSRWLKRTTNQIGFPIPQHNGIPNPDKLSVFGSFWKRRAGVSATIQIPIGSMYGIYANIRGILMVNVTIYSIHGSYGIEYDWTS